MSLLDLPHSVVRTIAGHRAKKTIVLMPITEEDTKPFPDPFKSRKKRKKKLILPQEPKKRKKRAKQTKEQLLAKRRKIRKVWMARPEVAEHQRKMNLLRQRRYMERKKARDRMATESPTTGSEGTS